MKKTPLRHVRTKFIKKDYLILDCFSAYLILSSFYVMKAPYNCLKTVKVWRVCEKSVRIPKLSKCKNKLPSVQGFQVTFRILNIILKDSCNNS